MTSWILRLFGLHTCQECAKFHQLTSVSWMVQKGIVYGTTPVEVSALVCDGRVVDAFSSTVKRCRYFKR